MKTFYQTTVSYINSIESYISDLPYSSAQNLLRYSPHIITIIGISGLALAAPKYIYFNDIIQKCIKIKSVMQNNSIFIMDNLVKTGIAYPFYNSNGVNQHDAYMEEYNAMLNDTDMEEYNAMLIEVNSIQNNYIDLQESNMKGMTYYVYYILAGAALEVALEITGF